jgi:hypothetical protein
MINDSFLYFWAPASNHKFHDLPFDQIIGSSLDTHSYRVERRLLSILPSFTFRVDLML